MARFLNTFKNKSLKKTFAGMVLIMVLAVTAASVLTIWGCTAVKNWLVPVTDEVWLHLYTAGEENGEETISRVRANGVRIPIPVFIEVTDSQSQEAVFSDVSIEPVADPIRLTPKRKLLYDAMSAGSVGMPILYAVAGVVLCSSLFFKKRLGPPFTVLLDGAKKIADNNLDFEIAYDRPDELGKLCAAFEKMRSAVLESQRSMWAVMEERKRLNASVAHDLRTPITVIEGYTEYLQKNVKCGNVDEEQLMRVLDNLSSSAARLERYVDSVRDIQSLDDIVPKKLPYDLDSAMGEAMRDIAILADKAGKKLAVESYGCDESPRGLLDKAILLRVLENVVSNALRYAEEKIEISFCVKDGMLSVTVQDDGSGFSKQALKSACTPFFRESGKDGHMGLGLAICTVLCGKHGGKLTVKNSEDGGAAVKFELSVN